MCYISGCLAEGGRNTCSMQSYDEYTIANCTDIAYFLW